MNTFITTRKVFNNLKKQKCSGYSDIESNDEYSQRLSGRFFQGDKDYKEEDKWYIGHIMCPKQKITLKDVKKVIKDDNEDALHFSIIKFIAGNCGITRDAFKYCRIHKIIIFEVGKMNDNNIYILYNPFKDKLNKNHKRIK